jgi:hypothetical protein
MDTLRSLAAEADTDPRLADIRVMAERLDGTLRTCQALLLSARAVDVTGLDTTAGRLCAAILDLPPEIGVRLRALLAGLLARLDAVELAFRGTEADEGGA